MPCFATGSAEGDARLDAQEAHKETTKVTRMLCSLLRTIEEHYDPSELKFIIQNMGNGDKLKAWWKEHKAIDAKRERRRKRARRKLKKPH